MMVLVWTAHLCKEHSRREGVWESQDYCVEAAGISCCAGDREYCGIMHFIGIKRKEKRKD